MWSNALKNKRLLVVSPFAETIESQYRNHRDKLHGDMSDRIMPQLASLQTVKAVQTIAGNNDEGWESWFEALEWMESEIDKKDFDIALLGCGAYGFPLAAYIKKRGKQAIHIGGSLQLYFGIKGKRWDHKGIYTDYWVRPAPTESVKNLEMVEGGCYW